MTDVPSSSCFVKEDIIFVKFDIEGKLVLISTNKGVRIFTINGNLPVEVNHPNLDKTGTVSAGSIYNGNDYTVIVGGNPTPKYAPNVFLVMEQSTNEFCKVVTLDDDIINVLNLSRTIVAVTKHSVRIINPRKKEKNLRDLFSSSTCCNHAGIISGGDPFQKKCYIAYPSKTYGQVAIVDANKIFFGEPTSADIIAAHTSPIACLSVSEDSEYLATASTNGTIIRIFKIDTKQKVAEFRRGSTTAAIHCLRFSPNNVFLACSSNNGSIHVFAIQDQHLNRRLVEGAKSFGNLAHVNDMRSIGSFSVYRHFRYELAFNSNSALNVVGSDGSFRQYLFYDQSTKETKFSKDPTSFDWMLEFCNCDMYGPCYNPPEGKKHPRNRETEK